MHVLVAGGFWTIFSRLVCGCLFKKIKIYTNGGVHSVPSVKVKERERERERETDGHKQSCELVCVCMCVNSGICFLLRLDCTAMDVINVL